MTTIQLKTKDEIQVMRRASMIVYEVLQKLKEMVQPGITTLELDIAAKELTEKLGAQPAFLGYPAASKGTPSFPGVICASRNEAIVHGIPDKVPLREGDIISIDYGCSVNGFFGDSALTVPVGKVSAEATRLLQVTEQCLVDAIEKCLPENRIGDISEVVQTRAESNGFAVVREFVGHGIGRSMHEAPHVPNYGKAGQGRVLKPGMVLAIEPMITAGSHEVLVLEDGWTAVTKDASLAAHFEHTIAITEGQPLVLSRP